MHLDVLKHCLKHWSGVEALELEQPKMCHKDSEKSLIRFILWYKLYKGFIHNA